ncbi:MAG: nicotinate-nucleotide adenylyltransferase [Mycoplasmataceae bacterium]|nr:nicotinate-nucleotide adenylyltransferase [Mycoplasmataceae bacterium]
MKIGIYGGSFNPIHNGHIKVAETAMKDMNLDKLFFVPAFKSPFKSKVKYAPIEDRIEMINIVKPENTEVSLFEANRKGVSYTIDTVRHFKLKYPDAELFLIIGSDNVYKLNKWRNINEIVEKAHIVVAKREGEFSKINIKRYGATLLNNDLFDFASSWFRKGYLDNVNPQVMSYIANNFLYIPEILVNMVDAKRHKHCIATGSLAANYAKSLGLDPQVAWAGGALHDITKNKPLEWHRNLLEDYGVDTYKLEDFELHSLSAYYWVKKEYRLEHKEILHAIKVHTSLVANPTTYDKIIYAADKLSEGRKFEGIQELRALMFKDFEKGFKILIKRTYDNLVATTGPLKPEHDEIYKGLM